MYETGLRNRRKKEADLFFRDIPMDSVVAPAEDNCSADYAGTYTTKNVTTYLEYPFRKRTQPFRSNYRKDIPE